MVFECRQDGAARTAAATPSTRRTARRPTSRERLRPAERRGGWPTVATARLAVDTRVEPVTTPRSRPTSAWALSGSTTATLRCRDHRRRRLRTEAILRVFRDHHLTRSKCRSVRVDPPRLAAFGRVVRARGSAPTATRTQPIGNCRAGSDHARVACTYSRFEAPPGAQEKLCRWRRCLRWRDGGCPKSQRQGCPAPQEAHGSRRA